MTKHIFGFVVPESAYMEILGLYKLITSSPLHDTDPMKYYVIQSCSFGGMWQYSFDFHALEYAYMTRLSYIISNFDSPPNKKALC